MRRRQREQRRETEQLLAGRDEQQPDPDRDAGAAEVGEPAHQTVASSGCAVRVKAWVSTRPS
jgi:hypothetical protein